MSTAGIRASRAGRLAVVRGEVGKLSAFLRRDFLVAWSYRLSFVTDWASMIVQVIVFNFVSKIVRVGAVPDFGGTTPTYMEYVAVGIAISSFMAVGLGRVDCRQQFREVMRVHERDEWDNDVLERMIER